MFVYLPYFIDILKPGASLFIQFPIISIPHLPVFCNTCYDWTHKKLHNFGPQQVSHGIHINNCTTLLLSTSTGIQCKCIQTWWANKMMPTNKDCDLEQIGNGWFQQLNGGYCRVERSRQLSAQHTEQKEKNSLQISEERVMHLLRRRGWRALTGNRGQKSVVGQACEGSKKLRGWLINHVGKVSLKAM